MNYVFAIMIQVSSTNSRVTLYHNDYEIVNMNELQAASVQWR
jgi:hypothetical protein